MSERLSKLIQRVDGLSFRERAVLFLGVVALMGFLWDGLLMAPLYERREALQARVAQLQEEVLSLNGQASALAEVWSEDPDALGRERLGDLRGRLSEQQLRLQGLTRRLVPPDEMARVLKAVLDRETPLQLDRVHGLGAEPVFERPAPAPAADATVASTAGALRAVALFKHGLRMEFSGGYMDTLDYLRALEDLPWKFLWERVSLEVDEYPRSRVSITVFSLSLDDEWIGI